MRVPSTMRVPVVTVACRKHADQVDRQPERADDQQLGRVHLGRVQQPLDRLKHDEDRDQAQEEAVGKARQGLHARVAASQVLSVSALPRRGRVRVAAYP